MIWKESRKLVCEIYSQFEHCRDYGFRDQIQRASVSVMNNIAEGFERYSDAEFCRFLDISKASSGEVRSMFYLAEDLEYIDQDIAQEMREKSKILSASIQNLIKKLKR